MKVLFLSRSRSEVEPLALAIRLRWPDLTAFFEGEAKAALEIIESEAPDLVIVYEDLPSMDIFSSIEEIRRLYSNPIIAVSESDAAEDTMRIVKALDLGADDYIRMPCNPMVVMARVVALLRRAGISKRKGEGPIRCGDLLIIPETYDVYVGARAVSLTPTEFKLLYILARNRGVVVSSESIANTVWINEIYSADSVKKYVQRLRRKLGDDAKNPRWIKTVHGMGYCLTEGDSPERNDGAIAFGTRIGDGRATEYRE